MLWAKLLTRLNRNVNEELLKQNELLKAQVLELQQHQKGRIRYTDFFKRHMARLRWGRASNSGRTQTHWSYRVPPDRA